MKHLVAVCYKRLEEVYTITLIVGVVQKCYI